MQQGHRSSSNDMAQKLLAEFLERRAPAHYLGILIGFDRKSPMYVTNSERVDMSAVFSRVPQKSSQ